MIAKQLAAIFVVAALLGAGAAPVHAQETTTIAPSAGSADQNANPAGRNRDNIKLPESDRTAGSGAAGADRDQGSITSATKDKPGRIDKDGSLPKPKVQDDPQHRCLSPAGIC